MGESRLDQSRRALEEAFFARQNDELLERMRRADSAAMRKQAMAAATGVTDDALLERWLALNMGPETVAALALVPLVLVAWSDDQRSNAAALVESWLGAPPPATMEDAWRDYVRALVKDMPADARQALQAETIGRARRVAEAAGGFLGLGSRVSAVEAEVLSRLDRAFTP
jgi:hypothetical protein